MDIFAFYSVRNPEVNRDVCCQEIKIARQFQESRTAGILGVVCCNDRAVCLLRNENVACRTSRIERHFETKRKKFLRDDTKKIEAFKKEVSRYEKQSQVLKKSFAVQIKVRKAATKLQNVWSSAGSF